MKAVNYQEIKYSYLIKKNDDGTFFGSIKELPGCMTEGDTLEEVFSMLDDAKAAWIATALELGREIPTPYEEVEYSGKVLLRLPKDLHARLVEIAAENSMSLNTTIVSLLNEKSGIIQESRNNFSELLSKFSRCLSP